MAVYPRCCPLLLAAGLLGLASRLSATDAASALRANISERLRSEFPYRPPPATDPASGGQNDDAGAIRMAPFVITSPKDKGAQLARIIKEWRQLEQEQRPSVDNGASADRRIGGRPATIGPRPYRELFKDDAKFKTQKAITPTWTLLDMKL